MPVFVGQGYFVPLDVGVGGQRLEVLQPGRAGAQRVGQGSCLCGQGQSSRGLLYFLGDLDNDLECGIELDIALELGLV